MDKVDIEKCEYISVSPCLDKKGEDSDENLNNIISATGSF